jgi:hypothetical protein
MICPARMARTFHVIADRSEWLVEFMRKRRGHLAHRAQTRNMNELGLQFLKPCLGLLMFGQVADEAGEVGRSAGLHFADRKMHRESGSVLALTGNDSTDADDMAFAGGSIAGEVAVVARTVRIWHQGADVLADGFVCRVAELPFGGAAEELHDAATVDDDHRIRNGFQDRAKVVFPRSESFLDLLLIINVDQDSAEVAGCSVIALDHTAARANPLAQLRLAADPVLYIETASGLDGSRDGLLGELAFFRVKQGKEYLVGKGQIVGYAKECPGRIRPKQPVRRKIQIPYANAGSFDTQPKALIPDGIVERWMDGGHIWPFLPGRAETIPSCLSSSYRLAAAPVLIAESRIGPRLARNRHSLIWLSSSAGHRPTTRTKPAFGGNNEVCNCHGRHGARPVERGTAGHCRATRGALRCQGDRGCSR